MFLNEVIFSVSHAKMIFNFDLRTKGSYLILTDKLWHTIETDAAPPNGKLISFHGKK